MQIIYLVEAIINLEKDVTIPLRFVEEEKDINEAVKLASNIDIEGFYVTPLIDGIPMKRYLYDKPQVQSTGSPA